jgi:glycine dehydrogenase subunit 1
LNHQKAMELAAALSKISGIQVLNQTFFNEFTVRLPIAAEQAVDHLVKRGILAGAPVSRLLPHSPERRNDLLIAVTEMVTDADQQKLVHSLGALCGAHV